jgi:hypothetical protein
MNNLGSAALGGIAGNSSEGTCPNCGYCKHCGRSNNTVCTYPNWVYTPSITYSQQGQNTQGIDFNIGQK